MTVDMTVDERGNTSTPAPRLTVGGTTMEPLLTLTAGNRFSSTVIHAPRQQSLEETFGKRGVKPTWQDPNKRNDDDNAQITETLPRDEHALNIYMPHPQRVRECFQALDPQDKVAVLAPVATLGKEWIGGDGFQLIVLRATCLLSASDKPLASPKNPHAWFCRGLDMPRDLIFAEADSKLRTSFGAIVGDWREGKLESLEPSYPGRRTPPDAKRLEGIRRFIGSGQHTTRDHLIAQWNVNSIRARMKGDLQDFISRIQPDIFAVSECRWKTSSLRQNGDLCRYMRGQGYFYSYSSSTPANGGYAGVAIFSKVQPVNVVYGFEGECFQPCGEDARIITVEFVDFHLVQLYAPCTGLPESETAKEKRLAFDSNVKLLAEQLNATNKPFAIIGDFNATRQDSDHHDSFPPEHWADNPSTRPYEMANFNDLIATQRLTDAVDLDGRQGQQRAFTWFLTTRDRLKNRGMLLDHSLLSHHFGRKGSSEFPRVVEQWLTTRPRDRTICQRCSE
jgi:exodeoxyribonuclease III